MSSARTAAVPVTSASTRPLVVRRLGTVSYAEGLALQDEIVRERRAGSAPDTLLLLEHPHVITLGSSSDPDHVLVDGEERVRLGIELFETGRGGDVTYHGPGQLVGYPIVALEESRRDLHRYLRDLEGALVDALAGLGVSAGRSEGLTGVWVAGGTSEGGQGSEGGQTSEGGKIAAIGVRVSSGWITSHGFALNVSTDLSYFGTIVPCGITDRPVTSIERELGRTVPMRDVEDLVARAVADRLGRVLA